MRTPPLPACLAAALASLLALGCERPPDRDDVAAAVQAALVIAEHTPPPREPPHAVQFADMDEGIALLPTPGFTLRRDFRRDYLAGDGWSALPGRDDSPGKPLVALVLDGSNEVTAAELRIGTSRDSHAVVTCRKHLPSAQAGKAREARIDGQPFRRFHVADAAMSHYRTVDAYRTVRDGRCIAIDLVVTGTRPEVYDPPRTPPFDPATAHARLQEALAAVRIVR